MPDQEFELDVFRDLLEEARIIGQLAEDEEAFREAYEAFRAGNARRFQGVLKRLGLR
jgi:aminoglycoside/choline kinase family phosphotransferase